tara:strand:+ start:101 stop:568 length:468 start_codon:yes stop_codon:yes gene_type:complete
MGMDVYGKNPINESGKYFRNNVWYWRPLATYACDIAPDITKHCEHWQSNDGDGLNKTHSMKLAAKIREDLTSGTASVYEQAYRTRIQAMPDEKCTFCNGTGYRKDLPGYGGETKPCNGCDSTGKVRPDEAHYPFELSNVKEFANFLENCGGFEIW